MNGAVIVVGQERSIHFSPAIVEQTSRCLDCPEGPAPCERACAKGVDIVGILSMIAHAGYIRTAPFHTSPESEADTLAYARGCIEGCY